MAAATQTIELEKETTCGNSPEKCGYIMLGIESLLIGIPSIALLAAQDADTSSVVPQIIIQLVWVAIVLMAIKCEAGCCLGCIGILNILVAIAYGIMAAYITFFAILFGGIDETQGIMALMVVMAIALWAVFLFKCVGGAYWFRIATTIKSRQIEYPASAV